MARADTASLEQMRWYLQQEAAGEAGFDDLTAMTQVKLPKRIKLELARNYWDEMGRGNEKGMHGPMLERLINALGIHALDRHNRLAEPRPRKCNDRHGHAPRLCLACAGSTRRH